MNTSKFTVSNIVFTVSAMLSESGVKFPFDKRSSSKHHEYDITVATEIGQAIFKFYGSEHDYTNKKIDMDESDLKHALYCFVSDACSGENGYSTFCNEFGYEPESEEAQSIHAACVKQLEKFNLICPGADIYDVVNELND